ncbi:MutS-related protein [Tumebacillus flagellatus]|uniref:DNA mismatch repair proteins mutS family domain-containing protein n=1 Tax=Tumebacillus flagellatus TaxID=1157490 RepID=A0A074MBZ8_9BACL|nr:hypothetical protein [Tumebacillus flagellatus]KEO83422.1 hypothetical protein EL26_10640 [Tumebacillus flagellatus]
MFWDETTKQALGWSDVWAQFQTVSKPGQRLRRGVRPFLPDERAAWQESMQDWQVARTFAFEDAKACRDALVRVPDLAPVLNLIRQRAGVRVVDLFDVKTFLWQARDLQSRLEGVREPGFAWWPRLDWDALLRLLNPRGELVPAFSLQDLGDAVLDSLQEEARRLEAAIFAAKKEQTDRLRAAFGKAPTRDGLVILEKKHADLTHEDLRLQGVNVFEAVFEVIEPEAVREMRAERERLLVEIEDREALVLESIVTSLTPYADDLENAYDACGRLDWALAKAAVAQKWGACAAEWNECGVPRVEHNESRDTSDVLRSGWLLRTGWHPTARTGVESRGGVYTPLDMRLQPGVGLITGPNMGGKTVALKTLGLLQALAQHALPVPADEFRFEPVDRIGWSGGDEQSLVSGLSSFGAEMQRLAALLREPTRALLLLDEVARTTNPQEGERLAVGLAQYLMTTAHSALFASHFPGVTGVPGLQGFRVAGLRPDVWAKWESSQSSTPDPERLLAELQQAMDYRLLPAESQDVPQDALRIARLFGLPEEIIRKEGP